ncbi:hypothetical protein P8452_58066 [Trifolium repens]|nr:hypothetical protein P8452_58066 [Trifolium repens]
MEHVLCWHLRGFVEMIVLVRLEESFFRSLFLWWGQTLIAIRIPDLNFLIHFVPNEQGELFSTSVDGLFCIFHTSGDINDNNHTQY